MKIDSSIRKSTIVNYVIILILAVFFIYKVLNSSFPLTFDESVYFDITESFIEGKYSYEMERTIGAAHYPLFYFANSIFITGVVYLFNLQFDEALFRFLNIFLGLVSTVPLYFVLRRISKSDNNLINTLLILMFYLSPVVFIYTWFGGGEGLGLIFTSLFIYYFIRYHMDESKKFLIYASTLAVLSVLVKIYCIVNLFILGILVLYKKEFSRFVIYVVVYPLLFVVLLSFILFNDPLLEFKFVNDFLTTFDVLPFQNRKPILISSLYGLGILLTLTVLSGFIVTKKNEIILNFILIGVVAYLTYFNFTLYFVRHLWVIVPFAIVATGYVFERLFRRKKSIMYFLVLIIIIGDIVFIVSANSVIANKFGIVGDWTINKEYQNYKKFEFDTDTWGMTNGHYPVLKHYINLPFYFYNGYLNGNIYVFKIWEEKSKRPNVVKVSGEDEQHLKYIVLDYIKYSNVSNPKNYVFYPDIFTSYAKIDDPLIFYINNYFERQQSFQHEIGETVLYKRNSPNVYSSLIRPYIYVGYGGDNVTNYNIWLSGDAWSIPKEIKAFNDKLNYRVARGNISEKQYSDFIIYNSNNKFNLTLEIINPILLNDTNYQFNIYLTTDKSNILLDKIEINSDKRNDPLISITTEIIRSYSLNQNNLGNQQRFLIESNFVPIHKIIIGE